MRFGPRTDLHTFQDIRAFCVRYEIQIAQLFNTAAFGLTVDIKETLEYFNEHNDFKPWPGRIPGATRVIHPNTEQFHANIAVVPFEVYCWRSARLKQSLGTSMEDAVIRYFKRIKFKPTRAELEVKMPKGRTYERRAIEFFTKGKSCNEWGLEIDPAGKVKSGEGWGGLVPLHDWA